MSSAKTVSRASAVARIGKRASCFASLPLLLWSLFVLSGGPADAPAADVTLNGLEMALDDQTGGIRSMRYAGIGELLSASGDRASLLAGFSRMEANPHSSNAG